MALNTWWEGDSDQRYWMEIATTGSMGDRLVAPKFPEAAWSYELVSRVRDGDRILHWQSEGGSRALVGWSIATADPDVTPSYTWQPRGTAGRALSGPRTTEGWIVSLGGFNPFDDPLSAEELQAFREPLLALNSALEQKYRRPTYFPFYLYGGRELRAQQGYLVKFPAQVFEVLPKIGVAKIQPSPLEPEAIAEDNTPPKKPVTRGRLTRIQDPLLRAAIETHAVDKAIEYYEKLGATGIEKLGKPYDLDLLLGESRRHVEVKGSSLLIETVELTINEVTHARFYQPTDLVVVDAIEWTREGSNIVTTGGRLRAWSDWTPADDDLAAKKFAYSLPIESPGGLTT